MQSQTPMDVKEVLKFADELIFVESDKHLDNLQEAILSGTLQGKKYSKVAEESYCTEGHVRDVAYELWELLSKALGEDVSKSNFRAAMERSRFSNISYGGKDIVQNSGEDIVQNCGKDFIQIRNVHSLTLLGHGKSALKDLKSEGIEQKTDRNRSGVSMDTVTVSSELELVISAELCQTLGISQGQKFQLVNNGDRIELVPIQSIQQMRGFLKGINTSVEREVERELEHS